MAENTFWRIFILKIASGDSIFYCASMFTGGLKLAIRHIVSPPKGGHMAPALPRIAPLAEIADGRSHREHESQNV